MEWFEAFIFWLMMGLLVFTQLAFGGVHVWAGTMTAVVGLCLGGTAVIAWLFNKTQPLRGFNPRRAAALNPALHWLLLFPAVGAIQLLPMPSWVVRVVSPRAFALKSTAAEACGLGAPRWMQPSLIPFETRIALVHVLAGLCMFGLMVWLTRRRVRMLQAVGVLIGMGLFQVFYGTVKGFASKASIWWYTVPGDGQLVHGTYINANHLAAFLEMVIPLCFGMIFAWWPSPSQVKKKQKVMAAAAQTEGSAPVYRADGTESSNGRTVTRHKQIKKTMPRFAENHAGPNASTDWRIRIRAAVVRFLYSRGWLHGKEQRGKRIILAVIGAIMGFGLFLTGSRGGIICFFAGTLSMAALYLARPGFKVFGRTALLLLLATIGYSLYLGIDVTLRIFAEEGLKNSRLAYTVSALPMLMDYPVLGTGMGTFKQAYLAYAVPFRSDDVLLTHLHNDWLETGLETGLIGLAAAVLSYAGWLHRCLKTWMQRHDLFALGIGGGAIAALISIGIHSLGDFSLHIPANALTVLFIAAIGWNALSHGEKPEPKKMNLDPALVPPASRKRPRFYSFCGGAAGAGGRQRCGKFSLVFNGVEVAQVVKEGIVFRDPEIPDIHKDDPAVGGRHILPSAVPVSLCLGMRYAVERAPRNADRHVFPGGDRAIKGLVPADRRKRGLGAAAASGR